MKILVGLSGQPRFYKKSKDFLMHSLQDIDVEFTFHLWSNDKHQQEDILNIYKPIKYEFEEPKDFDDIVNLTANHGRPIESRITGGNTISMLYSRSKLGNLIQKHTEESRNIYDFYIWTRTDICPIVDIAKELEDKDHNVFFSAYVEGKEWNKTHINNMLTCSSLKNILHYLDLYNHYQRLYASGIDHCDHRLTMAHMKKLNIDFQSILGSGCFPGDQTCRQWRVMRDHGLSFT